MASALRARKRFVTGVAPGLQNQWTVERSFVGSTPIRFRHSKILKSPAKPQGLEGLMVLCDTQTSPSAVPIVQLTNGSVCTAAAFGTLLNQEGCVVKKAYVVLALSLFALVMSAAPALAATSYIPDGLGGYRVYDDDGESATMIPDGLGGYSVYDDSGGSSAISPDGLGGYRIYGSDGGSSTVIPDGLGGYHSYDGSGGFSTTIPDGLGGYRTYDSNGNMKHCLPDGLGGMRCY